MASAHREGQLNQADERKSARLGICHRKTVQRLRVILCAVCVQIFLPQVVFGQDDSASEYELKAAMLYNLVQFVEWPPKAYTDSEAATILCILGRDPFGDSLVSLVDKQKIAGRPLQIRHVREPAVRDCHVLYVSSSERKSLAKIVSALANSSVLTVGEMAQFAIHGGMIQFGLEEKRLRFDINLEAASRANLQISSRLLALARIVKVSGANGGEGINASKCIVPREPRSSPVMMNSFQLGPGTKA